MTFLPQCVATRSAVRARYCPARLCALHAVPQAGQGYAGRFWVTPPHLYKPRPCPSYSYGETRPRLDASRVRGLVRGQQ